MPRCSTLLLPATVPLLLALPAACSTPSVKQACFVDAHCPSDMACMAGQCAAPDEDEDEDGGTLSGGAAEKLDVGGGIGDATSCAAVSLVATNAGCEFWAVDLPNAWHPSDAYSLDVAADQTFAVVVANVSADENAHVSVYAGAGGEPLKTAIVGPLGTYAFELPNDQQIDPEQNAGGKAFRIESDVPITAYQFQPLDNLRPVYSNDATSLLPAHVLQTDYIAVTSRGIQFEMFTTGWEPSVFPGGAYVTVVATEDDTHVDLYPTDALAPGAWQGVTLQRGQTFTILSDPSNAATIDGSLSGTRVISDAPVAAFSGNVVASVPAGTTACCVDHVEHQLLPTVAWGARYVAAPPPDPTDPSADDPVEVRLVGAFDDTRLVYPAGQPAGAPDVIAAHQEVVFTTTAPLIVESDDPEKPFAAAQFLFNSAAANPGGLEGDPGMILLPAIEQLMTRYVFLTPPGYRTSAVTIFAPHDAEITLDGEAVGGSRQIGQSAGETWGYRRRAVQPGAHVIESDVPFGITVVGYDDYVSYAYAGGSAVEAINDAPPAP